jgi:hypothetical protein
MAIFSGIPTRTPTGLSSGAAAKKASILAGLAGLESIVPSKRRHGILEFRGDWRRMERFLKKNSKDISLESGLVAAGTFLSRRMRVGILSGRPGGRRLRPNAPATIRKKKSNRPLLDFHAMVNNIKARRITRNKVSVGLFGDTRHSDSRRTVAEVGRFHEFLTINPHHPLRQFMSPVINAERRRIEKIIAKHWGDDFFATLGGVGI